ncbi:MAG: regulatory protein RecX [Phycisphaeraceae bacterium]|nr:regulatory protein RecX [Phycisphaeraceae bacterium]
MPRITALTPSRRNPLQTVIRVDGRSVATLSAKLVAELGLTVDMPYEPALAQKIEQAQSLDKAYRLAMRRLNRRALSQRELQRKLEDAGFTAALSQKVVHRLQSVGALNDRALGAALIRETIQRKPAGPHLLRAKLLRRGLDRKLIDELVATVRQSGQQVDQAAQLIQKRLPALSRLDRVTAKRRLWGLLARRGFEPDVIDQALRRVEMPAPPESPEPPDLD